MAVQSFGQGSLTNTLLGLLMTTATPTSYPNKAMLWYLTLLRPKATPARAITHTVTLAFAMAQTIRATILLSRTRRVKVAPSTPLAMTGSTARASVGIPLQPLTHPLPT